MYESESVSCSVMFSSVTPCAVAHKAPLSIGFLRQEYWNGLPFPSPGHPPTPGTEPMFLTFPTLAGSSLVPPGKDFKSESVSYSVTLSDPKDCSPPGSPGHGILQARLLEWIAIPFSREASRPRDLIQVSCIAGILFTIWATGKPYTVWIFFNFYGVNIWG